MLRSIIRFSIKPVRHGATKMTAALRRSPSSEPHEHPSKRLKVDASAVQETGTAAFVDDPVAREMALPFEFTKKYQRELDYGNKLILAPMVRSGTLPTRLLSLMYGAGLVWSPEVVDKAIIGAERVVDPVTGVITYTKGQGPIFSTHPLEKPYLIFQVGSSDPELAVKAAQVVAQDVSGIDLNCGCPKPFSTHSGMGAALLSTPDLLLNILRALLQSIPLPISCKIRMLPEQTPTLHLVARILRTGIRNLTVHCRTRDMRPRDRAMWERLGDIVKLGEARGIPVVCNGDGDGWANWERIRNETGATSVMLARAAERNPSVFRPSGPAGTLEEIVPRLLNIAEYIDNPWGNTKFLLTQFKPSAAPISRKTKAEKRDAQEAINKAKSVHDVAVGLGLELGKGKSVLAELENALRDRGDVWEERDAAVAGGKAIDEPVVDDAASKDPAGYEVGVGQAALA